MRDDNLYLEKLVVRTRRERCHDRRRDRALPADAGAQARDDGARVAAGARPRGAGRRRLRAEAGVRREGQRRRDRLALDLDVHVARPATSRVSDGGSRSRRTWVRRASVDLDRLNLAPILKDPEQRSDLTGHATVDLMLASAPEAAPALDRLRGTFVFDGPRVARRRIPGGGRRVSRATSRARASRSTAAPRLRRDGHGEGLHRGAGGGRARSRSTCTGRAAGVDLRRCRRRTGVPKLATNLSVSVYQVTAARRRIEGSATLAPSEVEGATIARGHRRRVRD